MAPMFRFSIRPRGAELRGEVAPDSRAVYQMALAAVSKTIDLGATPSELESDLHAYAEEAPQPYAEEVHAYAYAYARRADHCATY